MKRYRILASAFFTLLLLMTAQSVSAQGKRISRMEYDGYYVTLNYDDQDRVMSAYDTGVNDIAESKKTNAAIYTLSGQKVARTAGGALKRGAYILGGRKVIVR